MRKTLLLSTAALVASIAMASAQNVGGGAEPQSGAAMQHRQQERAQPQNKQGRSERSEAQTQHDQTSGQAQRNMQNQGKQGQSQRSEGRRQPDQTTGQAPQAQQSKQGRGDQGMQAQPKQGQPKQGQAERRGQRDQTTGQAPARQGQVQQNQAKQGQAQQGQAAGTVNPTPEQRTKIQQTVLARSDVPRVSNVNFSLAVGTAVPARVRVAEVPQTLIAIYPQWRGHDYFVVHDEIVIVDHSRKIVAMLPVGASASRGAQLDRSGGAVNFSEDQIREVQQVLIRQGFDIGEPDGVLGPRTRRALIAFQRRQGLQATGRIDNRTVGALGLSTTNGQGPGRSSTSGQGGAGQSGGDRNAGASQHGNQGANQPATTGQKMNPPSANDAGKQSQGNGAAARPSTTGQGSEKMQQAPANQGAGGEKNAPGDRSSHAPQNKSDNSGK